KQAQGGAPVDPVPTPAPLRILPPASPRVPPDPRGSESSIQNGVPVFRSDVTRFSHSDLTRIPRSDVIGIPHLEVERVHHVLHPEARREAAPGEAGLVGALRDPLEPGPLQRPSRRRAS